MMYFDRGQLADSYLRGNFGPRICSCLWCHSDGAWLQGDDWNLKNALMKSNKLHLRVVQSNCEVVYRYSVDELGLKRSLLPGAMLVIAQNLVFIQNLHKVKSLNVIYFTSITQKAPTTYKRVLEGADVGVQNFIRLLCVPRLCSSMVSVKLVDNQQPCSCLPSWIKTSRKLFSSHQESGLFRKTLDIWESGLVQLNRPSLLGILVR